LSEKNLCNKRGIQGRKSAKTGKRNKWMKKGMKRSDKTKAKGERKDKIV